MSKESRKSNKYGSVKRKKSTGTKIWLDDDSYIYLKTGQYVRQKLASRRGCETYRMVSPKSGRYILICRKKDGKWKAVSILRYVGIDLRSLKDKDEADDINKARELIKERDKTKG